MGRDRPQFKADADEAAKYLSAALQTSVMCPSGDVALPAKAFFVAARGEFADAVPQLSKTHELAMRALQASPNASLLKAKELFAEQQGVDDKDFLDQRIEAVVHSFLVAECLDVLQDPARHKTTLETLARMASMLARLACQVGRVPLAFAASCCAVWCACHLSESFNAQLERVSTSDFMKELEVAEDEGLLDKSHASSMLRSSRLLASHGDGLRRVQRYWNEHGEYRRCYIRFFSPQANGKDGPLPAAVDADLRLLFLPASASPAELATHVHRVRSMVYASQTSASVLT